MEHFFSDQSNRLKNYIHFGSVCVYVCIQHTEIHAQKASLYDVCVYMKSKTSKDVDKSRHSVTKLNTFGYYIIALLVIVIKNIQDLLGMILRIV